MVEKEKRILFLDSFRGIASLAVVISHISIVFLGKDSVLNSLFSRLGSAAVVLFFILSGIVLSNSLSKTELTFNSYLEFIFKRFQRINLPFIVILGISELIYFLFSPRGIVGVSPWFNNIGTSYDNFNVIADNVFMTGNNVDKIVPVIWTLIIEFRLSFVFPFLFLFVKKSSPYFSIAVAFFCFFIGTILIVLMDQKFLLGQTVFNLGFFIFGILIYLNPYFFSKLNTFGKWGGLLLVLFFYFQVSAFDGLIYHDKKIVLDILLGFGCVVIILIFYSSEELQKKICFKPFLWLGEISFSLYLVHCLVFMCFVYMFHYYSIPIVFSLVVSIPMIFICSYFYFKFVEKPSGSIKFLRD